MTINIGADATVDARKLDVVLVGKKYKINRIKTAMALKAARLIKEDRSEMEVLAAYDEIVTALFGEKVAAQITTRLEDTKDALDFHHLTELIRAVMAYRDPDEGGKENPTG